MKKIISLVLALTMLCSLLPAAVFAAETEQGESVVLTKTFIPASGGQPDRLKLEAWVTGSTTSTTTTKPTDIVLVLDQSGSMDETVNNRTKLSIMKSAVASFVSNVADLNEGRDAGSLHRVAVVGFASESGYSDNTEILTAAKDVTVTSTEYRVVTGELNTRNTYYIRNNEEYRRISYESGWNSGWYTSGRYPQRVDVDSVTVYERVNVTTTQPSFGVAYNDLEDEHYASALIDCTDAAIASTGIIGQAIDALDGNGATRADLGMEMAADIFAAQPAGTYGPNGREQVVVFLTDGVPTSFSDFDTGIANDAVSAAGDMKDNGAHIFSLYLGNPGDNAVSFMQAVSSNYPHATAYNNLGTQAATTYYSAHSDSAAITDVFTQIVNSINAHTTLTEQAVVADNLSPYFTLASGADTHSIKVYTAECTGYSNGEYFWSDTETAFDTAAVSISGKTIQVTNFNFPYHCVTQTNKSTVPGTTDFGRKLIIYVPIVEDPNTDSFGGWLPTNAGAGIYKTDDLGEVPVVTAPGRYDDVTINYSLHASERLTHLGLEDTLSLTLSQYVNTESNGMTMLEEAITRLPNGVNNAGVTMDYYLLDPGTNAGFGGQGPSDDTILATLSVEAGDRTDVTDFANWTIAPGIHAEDVMTLTIPDDGSNMAEKVLILACRLTSTKDIQDPDSELYYANLDHVITNNESFVVYGEIDQGGSLTVTDANNDGVITGAVFGNTYTEAVPYTENDGVIVGGDSDKMTFSVLPGYEIESIVKLIKNAAGEDVRHDIYSITGGTSTLTEDETLDTNAGIFTAQVKNIQTDTAYAVNTRLKQFALATAHDNATHIDPGHVYSYDAQNPLQVWFHATDGNHITSLALGETANSAAVYTAEDLLAMSDAELARLGLTLVTADGYDANGNAIKVITGGNALMPKTRDNYAAVTGEARYYKLTYLHYIENGSPYNTWPIPADVAENLAAGASIPADAKHTQVSYVAYGDTLTRPPLNPGAHRKMISDGVQYTFRGAFETFNGTEFTKYVDLVNDQGVISLTMPAHDEDYYGFWEKDPNVELNLGAITKVVNKAYTEDQTFSFVALFHEQVVGTASVRVPAGSTEAVSDPMTVLLTAAQQTRFRAGDKIYIYEVEDEENDLWLYDNTRYELSYGDEGITIAVSGTGAAAEKVVFTNRQKAPSLSVEKTLTSDSTAKVGDTVTWQIVVTNSGTAAGKFQLADKLNGEDLTYTTDATAENGWYTAAANSELTFDVSYTVQAEDAGLTLENVAIMTPEGEDPEEDPADPVTVDTYTVTYTDGVEGEEVFGDKMESGLLYNADTPKYDEDNTPVRDGYSFTGWTPVWQDKVTDNVTYTATWAADNYGITVTKTLLTSGIVKPGDIVTWEIEVTNSGNAPLYDVSLVDRMPGASGTVILLDASGRELPGNFTFDLAVNATRVFGAMYEVRYSDSGETLKNVIFASNDKVSDSDESEAFTVRKPGGGGGTPSLNVDDHFAYIVGYEDGTVRPGSNITRAETATIFFRLLTDEDRAYYWCKTNPYSDVSSSDWFNNAISTLTNADILEGMTATTFLPNEPITRAQFATMAARFSEVVYNGGSTFTDVPENHWAARYIALAQHLGYVDGYPDGTFRPDQHITRAEAMTLINRVLERAVEENHMLSNMVHWPDNPVSAWYYEAVQEATNSHTYTRTGKLVPNHSFYYENWTTIEPVPDWEALERSWSDAADVKRG